MNKAYDNLTAFSYQAVTEPTGKILGINIGKNKTTQGQDNTLSDYTKVIEKLAPFADYFVINVSSPNTPGLRNLQASEALEHLLSGVLAKRDELYSRGSAKKLPVLVKISPDLDDTEIQDMIASLRKTTIDGVIISNTTIERPETLRSIYAKETGGLSGKPLSERSASLTKTFYEAFEGRLPIISVGGIFNGQDVYNRLCNGASLVQLYSALALEGPGVVTQIKQELVQILREKNIDHLSQIIGSNTKFSKSINL